MLQIKESKWNYDKLKPSYSTLTPYVSLTVLLQIRMAQNFIIQLDLTQK